MRMSAALSLGLLALTAPAEAAERLVGKTLICRSVGGRLPAGWHSMMYLYVTPTNLFKQEAVKAPSGELDTGGSSAMGAVYEWNKSHSGNAGIVTFRTHATKGAGRLSFETKSRIPQTNGAIIDAAQKGTAQFNGKMWVVTTEQRQSSPHGPVFVPFSRESFRCQVKEGRHLL